MDGGIWLWIYENLCVLYYVKYLLGGALGVYFIYYMSHMMGRVGYECGAYCTHIFTACHLLFLPYPECLVYLGSGIAQKCEREGVFVGKFYMACRGILADTDYLVAGIAQFGISVA